MNLKQSRAIYTSGYSLLLEDKLYQFEAYAFGGLDLCLLMVFSGRARKPMQFKFTGATANTEAKDKAHAMLKVIQAKQQEKQAQKKLAEANFVNQLNVGDVLVSSWGWEQTNIDYYQVTKKYGKRNVIVREIAKQNTKVNAVQMTGECIPLPSQFIGDELKRKVLDNGLSVKISSFQIASLKPFDLVNEVREYKADRWTAYA